jgi:hypothetical protein
MQTAAELHTISLLGQAGLIPVPRALQLLLNPSPTTARCGATHAQQQLKFETC